MSKLMKTFDSVFSDELSEEPMRAPAMKIHLKPNPKPLRISTARQVPLRFKEESDKEVQSYIDKGVIVKVTADYLVCTWILCPKTRRKEGTNGHRLHWAE